MSGSDAEPYSGREQTQAKHFILRRYLEKLAYKILTLSELTYVDGFSGPWKTETEDFSDSSFMIAIDVLEGVQKTLIEQRRECRRIRCFFSESDPKAISQLRAAVARHHHPESGFEICTFHGEFEDAIPQILSYVGNSFALIFIDPTGWTGYSFDKIKALFSARKCEVLINFMYDHINRFSASDNERVIMSLGPVLGGPDWRKRLDVSLPRGAAIEKLFRETLKEVGRFQFVISTRIDKATAERPHFFLTYGTKSPNGLKTFRETEYVALRAHARNRANARERKREEAFKTPDFFAGHADVEEATIDAIVEEQKQAAASALVEALSNGKPLKFDHVMFALLERFMIRETDVKDICVELARCGTIENTWGGGNRKPRADTTLKLAR